MDSGPPDEWGDLLLDGPLPNAEFLDDLRLGFDLIDPESPPGLDGLDCLDLGGGGGGAAPSGSDLLESLQLDAAGFDRPDSSSGTRHSPCGSGSDSPLVLPLVGGGVPAPDGARRGGGAAPAGGPLAGQASPATSESENNGRGRSGSPAVGSAQRGDTFDGGAVGKPNRPLSEEEKRMARMQRNRENAQLSRQRKKQQMADLEERCKALAQQNVQLTGAVQRLTAENAQLRQQLALLCSQAGARTGGATPGSSSSAASHASQAGSAGKQDAVGAAAQPAAQGAAAGRRQGASPPAGTPVTMKSVLPQWPMLPFGLLPKVALAMQQQQQQQQRQQQQQQAARPAGGPSAAAAARPAQQAGGPRSARPAQPPARPAKRAKTTAAAGASTAFLALFTLFMFAGPFTPGTAPSSPAASSLVGGAAPQRALQALPEPQLQPAGAQPSDGLHHGGRGLRALPLAASEAEAGALRRQPAPLPPLEGGHLHRLLNSTLQELLLQPGNQALEAAALQRLQELGPVALLLDADGGVPGANPLAASAAFPGLAGQLFGAAGLEAPQVCRMVLEFDAAAVPHAARSRRSLERFVLGATGFRGRSLAAAAAADANGDGDPPTEREPLRIEPLAGVGGASSEEEGTGSGTGSALLPAGPPSASNASTLVSVLLPANASNGGALASVDKVFVVVLHPQDRYATYACALPRPVFL